ncbi:MAG: hypothetical protein CL910_07740 [Deltaproteobacteria bacterium]|jgi:hypothetical protein|nr:hypothetical protein [Deltaproteobacteria bacterium]
MPSPSLRPSAVVLAFALDQCLTVVAGTLVLFAWVVARLVLGGLAFDAALDEATGAPPVGLQVGFFGAGTLATVAGGALAAALGRTAPLLNAGAAGALVLAFGVVSGWIAEAEGVASQVPLVLSLLAVLVTVPAALLGGWLASRPAPHGVLPPEGALRLPPVGFQR